MRLTSANPVTKEPATGKVGLDDAEFVQHLKFRAYEAALEALEEKKLSADRISPGMLRDEIGRALELVLTVEEVTLSFTQRSRLIDEIEYELTGLGPIQPFLDDPSVNDIIVNGHKNIYVEKDGELEERDSRFRDDAHLMNIIQRIVGPIGRRVDESMPYVDARLADGSRVNVIIPPVALDGPMLSIRKFREKPIRARELVRLETMGQDMLAFLASAVQSRLNILICGGTGSGKTTLLNVLSGFIGSKERVVTIEDAAELRLQQRHIVRLETRPRSPDNPETEVTARDLVRNALRMRPDRIILGEVRGAEAVDMLQAMSTGHDGSMATIHANSPREALDRLEILVGFAATNSEPRSLRRYIANSVQVVIQVKRTTAGRRRVVSISEITGIEGEAYAMSELYKYAEENASGDSGRFEQVCARSFYAPKLKVPDLSTT